MRPLRFERHLFLGISCLHDLKYILNDAHCLASASLSGKLPQISRQLHKNFHYASVATGS